MNLKFVELHTALFLGGKNFQLKLDVSKFTGLKLNYDSRERWVVAEWEGNKGYIPLSNVATMVEGDAKAVKQVVYPISKVKAQVSTPDGIRNED